MKNKFLLIISPAFFVFYFIFNIYLLPHFGISWDESFHYIRGNIFLQYFLTGDEDKFAKNSRLSVYRSNNFFYKGERINLEYLLKNDDGHPPLNGILASINNRIFYQKLGILSDIDSYHLFVVLVSVFLAAIIFYWVKKEYGLFAGIISFLSLALYPLFFAESHFNIKDPVEASFYTATLLFFYNGITKNSWKWIIVSSVFAGLALGTKFNILFSVFTIAPWLVIYKFTLRTVIPAKAGIQKHRFPIRSGMTRMWIACILAPFIAFGILYATWPFLWQSPVTNLLKIFSYYKEIGSTINYQPQSYLLFGKINTFAMQWILYTTPLIILFFSIIGIFYSLTQGFKEKNKTSFLILFWFLMPIIRVTMPGTSIYGGVRQIMEYIPAMAILSGIGANYFVRIIHGFIVKTNRSSQIQNPKLKVQNYNSKFKILNYKFNFTLCTSNFELRKRVLSKKFLQMLVILSFLPITLKLISIHPNENVYFNPLIGGLKGAKEKNIIYWGNSFGNVYRQGIEWLNKNSKKESFVAKGINDEGIIPSIWFRSDINYSDIYRSGFEKKGEYIIELTNDMPTWSYYYYFNYAKNVLNPVYEVKVDNVSILTIWKNDIENTKKEYKKEIAEIKVTNLKREKNFALIDLEKEFFLTELIITFENPDCNFTNEGYFVTSDSNNNWTNHPGSLGEMEFYKNFNPRNNKDRLFYIFPAIKTRFVKIVHSENNNCFENIKEAKVKGFIF